MRQAIRQALLLHASGSGSLTITYMKTVTITQKDIERAKISFTDTGYIIDELAYSAGQWTSNDLYDNNIEYEPNEPYNYNFEQDLFEHTKTTQDLRKIMIHCLGEDIQTGVNTDLQAGAYLALNFPEKWTELLEAYTEKLKEEHIDSISEKYNTELKKEISDYHDDQYKEWLNGDHRDYAGVVYEIAKYFTEAREGSFDSKKHEYTFSLDDDDIQNYKDSGYKINQIKRALIDEIRVSSQARQSKDKQEREERRAERERLATYKAEQKAKEEAERKAKLLSMKLH